MGSQRVYYLDASVLFKLAVKESGSEAIEKYMTGEPTGTFYATSLCFAEALGALKSRYSHKGIDQETYFKAGDILRGYIGDRIELADMDISDSEIFWEVEKTAKRYGLDVVDAYQIVTIKKDYFSRFPEAQPTLVTADPGLAEAAQKEGFRVWDCLKEQAP
ncbi:MAG TPA: type II toxin-antitoxin system VapC family toxin [Thermodesulfobacteriota bacterium]|nr:type II toxin-antitoxin system VapC family toxin [Thermodesulfobacteriota bacterium]